MRKSLPLALFVIFITSAYCGCTGPQYKCDDCGQIFDAKEDLNRHKNTVHREYPDEKQEGETGPACEICGERPGGFDEFVAHMEKEHPDEWRKIKEGQE